jgi:hypothetical protein
VPGLGPGNTPVWTGPSDLAGGHTQALTTMSVGGNSTSGDDEVADNDCCVVLFYGMFYGSYSIPGSTI